MPSFTLLPLSAQAMQRTLKGRTFRLGGVQFRAGWAGEAAHAFPIYLLALQPGEALRGSFAVVLAGHAIGVVGTKHRPRRRRVEIGYGLVPQARGRGYATEAVRRLLEHLRGWPDVREVEAKTLTSNVGSIRVLKKCGFAQVGAGSAKEHLLWRLQL